VFGKTDSGTSGAGGFQVGYQYRNIKGQMRQRHCRAWRQAIAGGKVCQKEKKDVPEPKAEGRG